MNTSPAPVLKTKLAQVRGLGSAKSGTHHWTMQRLSAVALIPLSLWFLYGLMTDVLSDSGGLESAYNWLSSPIQGACMILMVIALFIHAQLGLQVIIEDYVHREWLKISLLVAMKGFYMFLTTLGIVSVLAIMFHAA